MYLPTRKYEEKEWGNLIGHTLFANARTWDLVFSCITKWRGLFANFHTEMTLYSEMLLPDFQPLKRCKGNGNLNE